MAKKFKKDPSEFGKQIQNNNKNMVKEVTSAIGEKMKRNFNVSKNFYQGIGNVFKGNFKGAFENVKDMGKNMWEGIVLGIDGLGNAIKGLGTLFQNHPSWYAHYPLDGLVNLNFGLRKGVEIKAKALKASIPNVIAYNLTLTKPTGTAWNQGIQYLYTNLRSANAGSVNYDQFDLERYVWDVRELTAFYCELRRIYAALRNFDVNNAMAPGDIFTAMGIDYDDFKANAANLRQYANLASLRISKLLPVNIDLISRTNWLFSVLFKDSNDAKGNIHMFNLNNVCYFGDSKTTTYAAIYEQSSFKTYQQLISIFDTMIEKITSNTIYNIIAGDIIKAYGQEAIVPAEIWDEKAELPIVYSEGTLCQINNATIQPEISKIELDGTSGFATQDITIAAEIPNTQVPVWNTMMTNEIAELFDEVIFNTYKDKMNETDTITMTRLTSRMKVEAEAGDSVGTFKVTDLVCATEIVTGVHVVRGKVGATPNNTSVYRLYDSKHVERNNNNTETINYATLILNGVQLNISAENTTTSQGDRALYPTILGRDMWFMSYLSNFNQHPYVGILSKIFRTNTNNNYCTELEEFDYNNFGITTPLNIQQIHEYASLSLLATTRLAKQSQSQIMKD